MVKIVSYFIIAATYYIVFKGYSKQIKRAKTIYEKILYVVFLFIFLVPSIIFLLDAYGVPGKIGYLNNVDSDRWFGFITQYIGAISGSVVSGTILLLITFWQNDEQKKNNNNEQRLKIIPIIDYRISGSDVYTRLGLQYKLPFYKNNKENTNEKYYIYNLFVLLSNVGINHAKNLCLDIEETDDDSSMPLTNYKLDKHKIMKVNDEIYLQIVMKYIYNEQINKKKRIILKIFYEDMLNNRYCQRIRINFNVTNIEAQEFGTFQLDLKDIVIENEEMIKEDI